MNLKTKNILMGVLSKGTVHVLIMRLLFMFISPGNGSTERQAFSKDFGTGLAKGA